MSTYTQTATRLRVLEHIFLWMFVASRFVLLGHKWGMSIGFDNDEHYEMVNLWEWLHPVMAVDRTFYAYHPPLGFLVARVIALMGTDTSLSIQLASFSASFVAFFFLRQTLRKIGLLWRPVGIGFLYITSSIPLQLYLATSFNLDVFVLAAASAAVYLSCGIHWKDTWFASVHPLLYGLILAITIASAMLFKFSGLLIMAIPFLAALSTPGMRRLPRRIITSAAICSVAIALVGPYYYGRYYMRTGELFPSNNNFFHADDLRAAREHRDADPWGYVTKFFLPTPVHALGYEFRDVDHPRLSDTWKDVWIPDDWLFWQPNMAESLGRPGFSQSHISYYVSNAYLTVMPLLMIMGILLYLRRRTRTPWRRLGAVLIGFSGLQVASLVYFVFGQPIAWAIPTKAIYIAPIVWGIGFMASMPLAYQWKSPALERIVQTSMIGFTGVFMVINHLLPVY